MSAAATAAGYLYASGRLSASPAKRVRATKLEQLTQQHIAKGETPARAHQLAEKALRQVEAWEASRR